MGLVKVERKVAQSCPTLCNPMDQASQSMGFSRQEYWSGVPLPSPRDLPNPGVEPRSPTLWADSLPAEPQGSPRTLGWVAYPFSSGSSQPRNRIRVSCITGRFFSNWAIREALIIGQKGNLKTQPGGSPGGGNGNPLQYSCWRIPWTKEPGGIQSMGLQRVIHDWMTNANATLV